MGYSILACLYHAIKRFVLGQSSMPYCEAPCCNSKLVPQSVIVTVLCTESTMKLMIVAPAQVLVDQIANTVDLAQAYQCPSLTGKQIHLPSCTPATAYTP